MFQRVLIVEDVPQMREAIKSLISSECEIVGELDDGSAVLKSALDLRPNIILLDISLPNVSGMVLLPQLRSVLPESKIIMLTNHSEPAYKQEAARQGADAYILKSNAADQLPSAIRNLCRPEIAG